MLGRSKSDEFERRPNPDPTIRTVAALEKDAESLRRELVLQREVLENKILSVQHSGETTYKLAREYLEMQLVEHKLNADERFIGVKEQTSLALMTQKEALAKQETGFTKQIDAIQLRIDTIFQSLDEKIHALEKRVDKEEGKEKGFSQSGAIITTIISVLIAIASLAVAFAAATP